MDSIADVAVKPFPPQAFAAGVPVVPIPLPLVNPPITKLSAVVEAVKGLCPKPSAAVTVAGVHSASVSVCANPINVDKNTQSNNVIFFILLFFKFMLQIYQFSLIYKVFQLF